MDGSKGNQVQLRKKEFNSLTFEDCKFIILKICIYLPDL
jgi:hypothetical protein